MKFLSILAITFLTSICFGKQIHCRGKHLASSLSQRTHILDDSKPSQESLDLEIGSLSFTVGYYPAPENKITIVKTDNSDGTTTYSTGSAKDSVIFAMVDSGGKEIHIKCDAEPGT